MIDDIDRILSTEPTIRPAVTDEGLAEVHLPPIPPLPQQQPPAQYAAAHQYSSKFISYLKKAENESNKGYSNGRWYPYRSAEGGADTIAYGHKMQSGERYENGISDDEAVQLLQHDLDVAWNRANDYLKKNFGVGMQYLPASSQEMLVDYAFNLGTLSGFPKFTRAVVSGDWATAAQEYPRYYGAGRPLTRRNQLFYAAFLAPILGS